jgi:hypothetical protein
MKVLHKDGEPVSFKLGGNGILLMGRDITGRECPVSTHSVSLEWINSRSGACITGGHRWSFEEVEDHIDVSSEGVAELVHADGSREPTPSDWEAGAAFRATRIGE